MARYYFGVYHWRRRFRRVVVGLLGVVLAALLWRGGGRGRRLGAAALAAAGMDRARAPLRRLLDPPPWRVRRRKYERLAARLPLADAETLTDVGCGTGRALVAMAPLVPADATTVGVDVFDARVILGNGPALAARNAARAGLDTHLSRGDACRLPLADDSQDVVTVGRVLHDLPSEADADRALREAHRVLRPDGRLGLLEVRVTHDDSDDALAYWRDRVAAAGFDVVATERVGGYVLVHADPA